MKKYGSIRHYIAFLRRQPRHMQHIYALVFAGSITALLAMIILYVDYGFWRERYVRNEDILVEEVAAPVSQSPIEMMSIFFKDAKKQLDSIGTTGGNLLEGKEVYIRGEEVQSTSSNQ